MAIQSDYSRHRGQYYNKDYNDYNQRNTRVSYMSMGCSDQPKNLSDDIATFMLDMVIYFILIAIVLVLLAIIFLK